MCSFFGTCGGALVFTLIQNSIFFLIFLVFTLGSFDNEFNSSSYHPLSLSLPSPTSFPSSHLFHPHIPPPNLVFCLHRHLLLPILFSFHSPSTHNYTPSSSTLSLVSPHHISHIYFFALFIFVLSHQPDVALPPPHFLSFFVAPPHFFIVLHAPRTKLVI